MDSKLLGLLESLLLQRHHAVGQIGEGAVGMGRRIRKEGHEKGPVSTAVAGFLEQLPPCRLFRAVVARLADSAGELVMHGPAAVAVLPYQDGHPLHSDRDDVHPVGIFEDVVILDDRPVRQANAVLPERQPRLPDQVG